MWFADVDESFNRSQHWVAALLVQHTRVNATARALRDVIEQASDQFGIGTTAELHGHDLFHSKREFGPMNAIPRARIALYSAALRTLADAAAGSSSAASPSPACSAATAPATNIHTAS
jgi:hypothetical protein